MTINKWFFSIGLILLILSGSISLKWPFLSDLSHGQTLLAKEKELSSQGQLLPITAIAVISDQKISLEVARTPEQQALGLMYRDFLPDDRGMLFPFPSPRLTKFWMKNCLINLDMIFLRQGVVQAIFANVPPCQTENCPTYGPKMPIDQVIELRGGRAGELNVKKGDRIGIKFIDVPAL